MADTEKKQGGGPQAMLRALLVFVALAVIAVGGVLFFTKKTPGGTSLVGGVTQGAQQVAMLDAEAIYALPEFTKAKKELEEMSARKEEELVKIVKDKKLSAEEAEKLRVQMRDALQQEQAKRVTPLNKRVTAAIATLAKERGYKVVFDKRIVVTGVIDVTEDVKKKFDELKTADLPKEEDATDPSDSAVGYINQETVQELRLFKEAQQRLYVEYQKMAADLASKTKEMSPADREKVRQDMVRAFQEKQVEVMKPVNDKVTAAITDVAKEKGLSLVLNSHHIMWGGRNLTDDVIKKLVI